MNSMSSGNLPTFFSEIKQARKREREYKLEVVVSGFGDEGSIGGQAVALQLIDHLRQVGREVRRSL